MNEWQDACDCTIALGHEIMGFQTKDIAEYVAPAEAVEKGGIRRREHEGIPGGGVFIARIADCDIPACHLLLRIHHNVQCPNVRRMPIIVIKSVKFPLVTNGTLVPFGTNSTVGMVWPVD